MAGGIVEGVASGSPWVGGGLGLWGTLRFTRWAIEFTFKRRDLREERLNAREKALESRYDARLAHLEKELRRTRRALMVLLNDTATNNPRNPILQHVAELLGMEDDNIVGPLGKSPVHGAPADGGDSLDGLLDEADRVAPDYHHPRRRT